MDRPTEDLLTALKSEVLGSAFFRSAYYAAFFLPYRSKVKALWQIEAQTKTRILEYFQLKKIEIPKLTWLVFKGSILGVFYPFVPAHLVFKAIIKETEYYLKVFRRLENQATDADRELFKYIVAHEVAIRRFAELELANSDRNSIESIEALLGRSSN